MSDERFDRIEAQLFSTNERIDALVSLSDERFAGVDQRFDAVDQRFAEVDRKIDELRTHMGVLHEEVLERIAAIPEYDGPTRSEFAEMKGMFLDRIVPLEIAVRDITRQRKPRRRR